MKSVLQGFKNEMNLLYVLKKTIHSNYGKSSSIIDLISKHTGVEKYELVETNENKAFRDLKSKYMEDPALLVSYIDEALEDLELTDYVVDNSLYDLLAQIIDNLHNDEDDTYWFLNNEYLVGQLKERQSLGQDFDLIRMVVQLLKAFKLKLMSGDFELTSDFLKELDVMFKFCEILCMNKDLLRSKSYE